MKTIPNPTDNVMNGNKIVNDSFNSSFDMITTNGGIHSTDVMKEILDLSNPQRLLVYNWLHFLTETRKKRLSLKKVNTSNTSSPRILSNSKLDKDGHNRPVHSNASIAPDIIDEDEFLPSLSPLQTDALQVTPDLTPFLALGSI
jgi:hypothetical protein